MLLGSPVVEMCLDICPSRETRLSLSKTGCVWFTLYPQTQRIKHNGARVHFLKRSRFGWEELQHRGLGNEDEVI